MAARRDMGKGIRIAMAHVNDELQERIRTLEDTALLLEDLANGLPEHTVWLWRIVDKLTAEAKALRGREME